MHCAGTMKTNVKCAACFSLSLCLPSACDGNGIFHARCCLKREEERIKITKETSQTFENVPAASSRLLCSLVNEVFVRVLLCSSQSDRKILINCSYIMNVLTSIDYRRSVTLLLIENIKEQLQLQKLSKIR